MGVRRWGWRAWTGVRDFAPKRAELGGENVGPGAVHVLVLCYGQVLVEKGTLFWEGMGTWGITGAVTLVWEEGMGPSVERGLSLGWCNRQEKGTLQSRWSSLLGLGMERCVFFF